MNQNMNQNSNQNSIQNSIQNETKKRPEAIIEELPPENRSREIFGDDQTDLTYVDAEYTEATAPGSAYAAADPADSYPADRGADAAQMDPAEGGDEDALEELEFTAEAVDEENLPEYEGVILPDIYELLEETAKEEPLAEHYLCIGVRQGSDAVAALILEMEEGTGDLVILSLYVAQEYRRLGLGTQMIHHALEIASESFVFAEGVEEEMVQMKSNSLLPEAVHEVWHAFLESVGFTDFIANPGSFALGVQELKNTKAFSPAFSNGYTPAARFVQASELSQEEQQELAEVVMDDYSPYYSIVSGSADARETVVIIDQVDIDTYRLLLADCSPVTSERDLIRTVCVALHLIYADAREFTLIIREDAGAAVPLLRQALPQDAQLLVDEQGSMDVVFHV